jgi:NTE family protein
MRVALSLGSGGARGYAHIGVLDVLEARGHQVVAIAGTSMGALVGGLAAADCLSEFTDWVTSLSQRDVLLLLDPTFNGPGMIKASRVLDRVATILDGARIEELAIPFTAVATDLDAQREVWFERGLLITAIRASIAIPSAITPVMLKGRLLADGGIMNPVPMEPLSGTRADFTLAVDLNGKGREIQSTQPVSASSDEGGDFVGLIRRSAAGVMETDLVKTIAARIASVRHGGGVDELGFEELPHDLRTIDVLGGALSTSQALITRFRMAANPPDVLVSVPGDACATWDFHRATELIELGRTFAAEALDRAGY